MWLTFFVGTILLLLIYKLFFSSPPKSVWKQHGVQEMDVTPVASSLDMILGRKSLFDVDDYIYESLGNNGKYSGFILQGQPSLLVKDLEVLKKILIKDFDHFMDRRQFFNESDGCLMNVLFNMEGEEWKAVRASVSPTFTTGKIRRMMDCFNEVGKKWVAELSRRARVEADGSLKIDVMSNVNLYTVDTIASAVFGLNAGAVENPDSEFMKMANRIADIPASQIIKFAIRSQFPAVARLLGLTLVDRKPLAFFEAILTQGLKQRLNGSIKRNDFIQLLVEARTGKLNAVGADELNAFEKEAQLNTSTEKKECLTEDIMIAQCVAFFFAGFSSTSTFISFALYALAAHEDVQDRLRMEISSVAKEDGTFDYDDLGKLVYLDMVCSEVTRKFGAAGRIERLCVKDYKDPESGLFVPKGTTIAIPVKAIHHDPKYYENPNSFNPNHFNPENKAARNPYAYLPFGIGPRNCIGMRFAIIEGKTAVAHVVHNFKIEPTIKTPLPPRAKSAGLQFVTPDGLELKLTPIRKI